MIRPRLDLRAFLEELRAARALRTEKARAERDVGMADALSTRFLLGPRAANAAVRADRLYRKAARSLPAEGDDAGATIAEPRSEALRRLFAARARFRAALLRTSILALPWLLIVGAVIALVAQVPPIKSYVSPKNIAARHPWRTNGPSDVGAPTHGSLPGRFTDRFFFHTAEIDQPWIEVDLEAERVISAFSVENRTDCCQERALPLVLETSLDQKTWTTVARRRGLFTKWKMSFPEQRARYVRFRSERTTNLHLKSIKVY